MPEINDQIGDKRLRSTHYARTDRAVVLAFCRLLRRKPYEKITVADLLEETPISRAAFSQHFTGKEAIAAQMYEEYCQVQSDVIEKMGSSEESAYTEIVRTMLTAHWEVLEGLQHIHTEEIDLRERTEEDLRRAYVRKSKNPRRELEAEVYAGAMSAYRTALMKQIGAETGDPSVFNEVMINVFLEIMHWSEDKALRKTMEEKLGYGGRPGKAQGRKKHV